MTPDPKEVLVGVIADTHGRFPPQAAAAFADVDLIIHAGDLNTNQVLAQIELWTKGDQYENKVYVLPKKLDEKVARLHRTKIGAELTTLTQEQADYISVPVEGPFKPEYYRY